MMTLDNFEAYVPYKIWERGEEYYESGAVTALEEILDGEWTATVEGTDDYEVEISIEDGIVTSQFCDCPYDGEVCKHVVATILAIRNQQKKASCSAFSKKSKKSSRIEDAIIVKDIGLAEDVAMIEDSVNESSSNDDLQRLLSLFKPEELSQFVLEYASQSAEFAAILKKRIVSKKLFGLEKDFRAEVHKAFNSVTRSSKSRYRRYDDPERDWETIFEKVDSLLEKARLLTECENLDGAIVIALQVLRSIGEEYDDELLYDDGVDASCACEEAGDLIVEIVEEHVLSQEQKDWIFQELCRIAEISIYRDYGIYDIDELVQNISISTQPAEKSLELLDQLLEERKDSFELYEVVFRKVSLLQKMGEGKKADATIRQYLYLPQIRRREVDQLIANSQYTEAFHLLDEGIRLAEKEDKEGTVCEWQEKKLAIYEKLNNTVAVIDICRQLFLLTHGDLAYYKKLKKLIPETNWKVFLESMMQETKFHGSAYFINKNKADIYVYEKDNNALFHLLESKTTIGLDDLMQYAPHLRETHSVALLTMFSTELKVYAERNMGRKYYEYIAKVLKIMQKLKGGDTTVLQLVSEFRVMYKRRPAMMEELRHF